MMPRRCWRFQPARQMPPRSMSSAGPCLKLSLTMASWRISARHGDEPRGCDPPTPADGSGPPPGSLARPRSFGPAKRDSQGASPRRASHAQEQPMIERLKRLSYALVLAAITLGLVAVLALALTAHLVIGAGRLGGFVHRLESFDFKWWLTGLAFVLWLFPILLLITYLRTRRMGQELHRFKGGLRQL